MIVLFHMLYYVANIIWNKFKPKLLAIEDNDHKLEENITLNPVETKPQLYDLEKPEEGFENTEVYDNYDPRRDVCVYDQLSGKLTFVPPLYIQRYQTVMRVLTEHVGKVNSIAEFGCAEFSMLHYYKRQPGVTEVLFIDIDQELLDQKIHRVNPLTVEYMKERETELSVKVFCGDVSKMDERMRHVDVVVAIELIEHLFPPTLEDVPFNVLGFIQPPLVIVTTPNGEFNYLFDDYVEGTFRHDDHKFEWNREQFSNWAENIVTRYPNYTVQISGIGPPPFNKSVEEYGHCSQMAVFTRVGPKVNYDLNQLNEVNPQPYNLVKEVIYPVKPPETRSPEQILFDEMTYLLFSWKLESVPLSRLYEYLNPWCSSVEHLREILERNCRRLEFNEAEREYYLINDEYQNTSRYSSDEETEWNEPNENDLQEHVVPVVSYSDTWESWDEPVSPCEQSHQEEKDMLVRDGNVSGENFIEDNNSDKYLTEEKDVMIVKEKNVSEKIDIIKNDSDKDVTKEKDTMNAKDKNENVSREIDMKDDDSEADLAEDEESDDEEEAMRKAELKRLTLEMKRVEDEIEKLKREENESLLVGDNEEFKSMDQSNLLYTSGNDTFSSGNVHSSTLSSDTTSSADHDSSLNLSSILMNTTGSMSSSGTDLAVSYNLKSHITEYDSGSDNADDENSQIGDIVGNGSIHSEATSQTEMKDVKKQNEEIVQLTQVKDGIDRNRTDISLSKSNILNDLNDLETTVEVQTADKSRQNLSSIHSSKNVEKTQKLRDITNENSQNVHQFPERKVLVAKKKLSSPLLTSSVAFKTKALTENSSDISSNREIVQINNVHLVQMKTENPASEVRVNKEIASIREKMENLTLCSPEKLDRTTDWVNRIQSSSTVLRLAPGKASDIEACENSTKVVKDETLFENLSDSLEAKERTLNSNMPEMVDQVCSDNLDSKKTLGEQLSKGKEIKDVTKETIPVHNVKANTMKEQLSNQRNQSSTCLALEVNNQQVQLKKQKTQASEKQSDETIDTQNSLKRGHSQVGIDNLKTLSSRQSQETDNNNRLSHEEIDDDYLSCAETTSKFDTSDTMSMFSCRSEGGDTQFESASEYQTSYYSMSDDDSDSDDTLVESDHNDTFQNDSSDES